MDDEKIPFAPPAPAVGMQPRRDPIDAREDLLERDLNDVYLLMDYLSGRSDRSITDITLPNQADPARPLLLIDEVCKIGWPLDEERIAHATQASILFKARDKLNQLASPATGATIAYTILVLGDDDEGGWRWRRRPRSPEQKSRADLARKAYPSLANSAACFRRWVTRLQTLLLVGLAATSLLSWNVASGKLILQRIEQLDAQAVDIGRTLNAGDTSAAPPAEVTGNNSLTSNLPAYARSCYGRDRSGGTQAEMPIRQQQTCETARLVLHRRAIADRDLDEWASYWDWLKWGAALLRGEERGAYDTATTTWPGEQPQVARGIAMEQWASDLITVLGNFVLPMLYGFLGATTSVVLGIHNKLRESRLAPREQRMSQVQLVLGIIVGACIGLFMSPSAPDAAASAAGAGGAVTGGSSVALSASALSFLAGFGVEAVFRKLQSMLQVMFGGETTEPSNVTYTHTVQTHITQVPVPAQGPPTKTTTTG